MVWSIANNRAPRRWTIASLGKRSRFSFTGEILREHKAWPPHQREAKQIASLLLKIGNKNLNAVILSRLGRSIRAASHVIAGLPAL